MQVTLIIALVLHILSGVFWAGTTFVLARTGGYHADRFFRPQMGAAAITVVTGGVLWFLLHRGAAGIQEHLLAAGAVSALLAASVQGAAAPALRQAATIGGSGDFVPSHRVAVSQRIAAALLAIAVVCMASARYA